MISDFLERQKNDLVRDISALGSLFFYIFLMVLFLLLKNYSLFSKLLFGLLIIYIVTIPFRTFLFRERPKKIKHDSYIEKLDAASFPSLHASRTAFMAAMLMKFFNNYIISILLVLIGLSIAYSRIYLKKHDLKDVIAGIIFGILAYFVVNLII